MRIIIIGILLLSFHGHSQGYTYHPDPYKGHEFINEYTGAKPIQDFMTDIIISNPHSDSEVFGDLMIIFKFDSIYKCHEIEVINMVDPYYDSLISKSFLNLGKSELQHLEANKLYGLIIKIGPKKHLDNLMLGLIMFADGKTEKAEKIYSKLQSISRNNSQIMFYLGQSQLKNGNVSGIEWINKSAAIGDVDAIKYLEKNKP